MASSGQEPRSHPILARGDLKHALGYLGSSILFVGLFLPLFDVPAVGSVNYFWNGGGAGAAVLLLVLGSVGALVLGRPWVLWLTGVSSLVVIGLTLLRAMLQESLAAAHLLWGWPVLFLGGVSLVASAEVGRRDGVAMPRVLWDVVVATSVLLAAVVMGPDVLSGTQQALAEFQTTKKIEERERWVPHESAREEMAAVRASVQRDEERVAQDQEAEALAIENDRRLRAEARRAAQVRLVSDMRRWYPRFAESLRPVLDARQVFLREFEDGGLLAAAPACGSVAAEAAIAKDRLPSGPDRVLDSVTLGLLDLYLASAEACRDPAGVAIALHDLERAEERIGAQLEALGESLMTYCLALPGGGAAGSGALVACDPRDRSAMVQ